MIMKDNDAKVEFITSKVRSELRGSLDFDKANKFDKDTFALCLGQPGQGCYVIPSRALTHGHYSPNPPFPEVTAVVLPLIGHGFGVPCRRCS